MRNLTGRGARLALGLAGAGALALTLAAPASAATGSGPLMAWGSNAGGQLGDGNFTDVGDPVTIPLPAGVTVVSAATGMTHTLAVTSAGGLLAWGTNSSGQLGTGNKTSTTSPVSVSLPANTKVAAVAAGDAFSLALTTTGTVLAWGANSNGQLGDGTGTTRLSPVPVALPPNTVITAISAGPTFALALTSDGRILAWGQNNTGQLGNLSGNSSSTPAQIPLPAGTQVTQISAGGTRATASAPGFGFGMALTSTGTLYEWGDNSRSELARTASGPQLPVTVTVPGARLVQVSAGSSSSYSVDANGIAQAWGDNSQGQLGTGPGPGSSGPTTSATPMSVVLGPDAARVIGADQELIVLTTSGQAWAAGIVDLDQDGNGQDDIFATGTPAVVPFFGFHVTGLFSGPSASHALALVTSP